MTASLISYLDPFLFTVFPYMAFAIFFLVTIQRYRERAFSYTSLSSQFLENQFHFWGMVPFHYGILTVLAGHLVAFAIPRGILAWNSRPLRLYVLEVMAYVCALFTLVGLINLVWRRLAAPALRQVTTRSDWILLVMLLWQVFSGIYIAMFHPWGSSWFAASLSPYLWSLLKFSPELAYVAPMPLMVKLHMASAFAIVAYFPFTRLVHILVVPNPYLWRRTQVARWYGIRRPLPGETGR